MLMLAATLLVVLASVGLNLPLLRKPLVVDEGNWFYLAAFHHMGVRQYHDERCPNPLLRPYRTAYCTHGYFDMGWWAAVASRAFGRRDVRFFQSFKAGVLCLAAVTTCWTAFALTGHWLAALAAGLLLALITATPETLFCMTYGEFGQIGSINVALAATALGAAWHRPELLVLAGLATAQTIHFKPTGWLFAAVLGFALLLAQIPPLSPLLPVGWAGLAGYASGLAFLILLPLLWLHRHDSGAPPLLRPTRVYLHHVCISPLALAIRLVRRWLGLNSDLHPEIYTTMVHAQAANRTSELLHRNLDPPLRVLWPLLVLAGGQLAAGILRPDAATPVMAVLLLVHGGSEYLQRAFYTPHFGPFWAPVAVLTGMTLAAPLSGPFSAGAGVVLVLALCAAWLAGSTIRREFRPERANMFGYHGAFQCAAFSNAGAVGQALRDVSAPGDKLLVMGDAPHVYVHAQRECFHPSFLFMYYPSPRLAQELLFLRNFRLMPPEWVQWYDWRLVNDWNIERLQDAIGLPYHHVHSVPFRDPVSGHVYATGDGKPLEWPLYRRDDAPLVRRLLGRAQAAEDAYTRRCWLEDANRAAERLNGSPLHWEAGVRLDLCDTPEEQKPRLLGALARTAANPAQLGAVNLMLAEWALAAQQPERAATWLEGLELASDPRPDVLRGELAYASGRRATAIRSFNAALRLDRWEPMALNGLGVVLLEAGQTKEAEEIIERAFRYHPEHPAIFANLAALWGEKAARWYRYFWTCGVGGKPAFPVNGNWTMEQTRHEARTRAATQEAAP